ncbi:hypothetical protein GCM10011408_39620 [Dyella caseinilytica]|nr:hypothetical protein GCM10011408_39620 [Dyella caseinilytica]
MNGGAVVSTHVRAGALLHGVAQRTLLANAASSDSALQTVADDASGSRNVLADDNDADDEPALLLPLRVSLDYVLCAVPLSASAASYPAPITSLLRPPNLA